MQMEAPFAAAVAGIVADAYLPLVASLGARRKLKVFALWTKDASVFTVFYHFELHKTSGMLEMGVESNAPVDCIPALIKSTNLSDLHTACFSKTIMPLITHVFSWVTRSHCLLFTSFHEPPHSHLHHWPFNPLPAKNHTRPRTQLLHLADLTAKVLSALHLPGQLSPRVGTLSEISSAFESGHVRYLWVRRESSKGLHIACNCVGLIVPWCQQLEVLCHPSVGGFLTHCGWNSTLEGVYAGVSMLAFLLSLDQYPNSKLIVDEWKVGVRVFLVCGRRREIRECVERRERAKRLKKFAVKHCKREAIHLVALQASLEIFQAIN